MQDYKIITIKSHDELEQYLKDWQELYNFLKLPISYNPNWLIAWLNAYNENNVELDITFVYDTDRLLAVIPFMIRIELEKRFLKFLSDSCSDYLGIPFTNEVRDDLIDIITERFKKLEFTHINFNNIHDNDPSLSLLIFSLANYGIKTEIEPTDKSLSIDFNKNTINWLKTKLSNRKYKYILNAINRSDKISFKVINQLDSTVLDEIFNVHIEKWESNKIIPQFSDERRKKFVSDIAFNQNELSGLICFTLYANNKLISYQLGFIKNAIYYDWNTSFDMEFKKYSPGLVLFTKIIQYLLANEIVRFDFMNGNERYKHKWATNISSVIKITGKNKSQEFKFEPFDTLKLKNIKTKKCLILDIHGIIFKGGKPILSTIEGIKKLQAIGIKIGILTNTSAVSVSSFLQKFQEYGISIDENHIMTSAIAIRNYLLSKEIFNCYLIGGEPELPILLKESKINIVHKPTKAEAVVVGFSKEFKYSTLIDAYEAIQNGADFICSDTDLLYASENKNLPGAGWIVTSIASVCNKEPLIIGKPNDYSLRLLMKTMNVKPTETMFIGDSIDSDIKTGKKVGIETCLHLGGVSLLNEVKLLPTNQRPDFIISSFEEIVNIFIDS